MVDELSLIKEEPIRVKVQAREIDKIRGFVEVFMDGVGYDIKFVPERQAIKSQVAANPPPPPPKRDEEGSGEDEDLLGFEDEEPRGGDRGGNKDKSCEPRRGESSTRSRQNSSSTPQGTSKAPLDQGPIEMYDPISDRITDLTKEQKETDALAICEAHKE